MSQDDDTAPRKNLPSTGIFCLIGHAISDPKKFEKEVQNYGDTISHNYDQLAATNYVLPAFVSSVLALAPDGEKTGNAIEQFANTIKSEVEAMGQKMQQNIEDLLGITPPPPPAPQQHSKGESAGKTGGIKKPAGAAK